jgi:hypothetical protein
MENDSIYIFKCYLDKHFPNSGILCFGQPEYYRGLERHDISYNYSLFIHNYYEYLTEEQHIKNHPLYLLDSKSKIYSLLYGKSKFSSTRSRKYDRKYKGRWKSEKCEYVRT